MFGERLRAAREAAGFASQQALADDLGVAQSTIANWEGGRREPNYALTLRLCERLQVSVDYLLGRTEDPQGGVVRDSQVRQAVWGEMSRLSPEDEDELWDEVREYARYRLQHYRKRR